MRVRNRVVTTFRVEGYRFSCPGTFETLKTGDCVGDDLGSSKGREGTLTVGENKDVRVEVSEV